MNALLGFILMVTFGIAGGILTGFLMHLGWTLAGPTSKLVEPTAQHIAAFIQGTP